MLSIKELRQICQTSEQSPSWRTQSLEGKFNRFFSIYLTRILIKLPITPNQITVFGSVVYLGSAVLFVFSDIKLHYLAILLIWVSFLLDACDGEVARYRRVKGAGVGGAYVEPVSHDIMYAFFFLPIGVGVSLKEVNLLPLVLAFIATASKLLFRLAELRLEFLRKVLAEGRGEEVKFVIGGNPPKSIFYLIYRNFFTGTGIFTLLIIAVFIKHLNWFLGFYAIIFFLLWVYKMYRQQKRIRQEFQKTSQE